MTRARLERVNQVLALRQPDLTVILDGVHKPHNVAAILRSCDAVGVLEVHMAKPRCGFGRHHMTSGGTQKWMQSCHYEGVAEAVAALKARGFRIWAANKSPRSLQYQQLDYSGPTAFLMGAELYGVERAVLEQVDGEVFIPMMGMVESFNVSVACAILLAEAQRQRTLAGRYLQPALSTEQMDRLRFEWLHPELAEHYRQRGEPYPLLDEDGDVRF